MDTLRYLPILSTLCIAAFAYSVLQRYVKGRRMHALLWGVGLILYGLGTLSEAGLAFVYHPLILKLWYLSGAMLTAAWLGQGTVHLLVRRGRWAQFLSYALLAISLVALVLILVAPVTAATYDVTQPASAQYKELLVRSGLIRLLTVLLNIYGTLTLVGGAVVSAWLFLRKQALPNRVAGNVLIAVGALMPAGAGALIRAGLGDWLYASELLGAVVMFAGFRLAVQPQPAEEGVASAVA